MRSVYILLAAAVVSLLTMKRDRLSMANDIANEMYTKLEEGTENDPELFNSTVQTFVEMKGIAPAIGFQSETTAQDLWTISGIITNIRHAFEGILRSVGVRFAGQRSIAQSTASVCYSKNLQQKSVTKVTGIPKGLWRDGGRLAEMNGSCSKAEVQASIPLSRHQDAIPWESVWEWFHSDDCAKVIEDKQTKRRYTRKKFTLPDHAKTTLNLNCAHRVRFCSSEELALAFTESEFCKKMLQDLGKESISLPRVQACICSCIKECKRKECSCPDCTGFREKLKAWDNFRDAARKDGEVCHCQECADDNSKWRQASKSSSAWRRSTTCGKVDMPELGNPSKPDVVPAFNRLECSLLPRTLKRRASDVRKNGGPTHTTVHYPGNVDKCTDCGWDKIAPDFCPIEMSDKPCKWTEKVKGVGPKGEDVWTVKHGTRAELLESIQRDGPRYNYHMWVNQWTSWQYDLDAETFDGATEIVVVTDFSAVYEMKDNVGEKCTHGTHCNQLVALVLHSPGERPADGGERPVVMDVWRFWSQKKGNAEFHQMAMKEIAIYYKNKIPSLKRIKVKSDGSRTQYKGRKNLGPMTSWPHPPNENEIPCFCEANGSTCGRSMLPGLGLEIWHDFSVSHHGSGPVDSYGKDARRGMDLDTKFGRLSRYDFSHCLDWCERNMSEPASNRRRKGKWSASGSYQWRGYSDGFYPGDKYPVIPEDRNWQQLPGSNEFYTFRARSEYKPELHAQFVPCYCSARECPHTKITNAHAEFYYVHQLPSPRSREVDSDDE